MAHKISSVSAVSRSSFRSLPLKETIFNDADIAETSNIREPGGCGVGGALELLSLRKRQLPAELCISCLYFHLEQLSVLQPTLVSKSYARPRLLYFVCGPDVLQCGGTIRFCGRSPRQAGSLRMKECLLVSAELRKAALSFDNYFI